MNKIYKIAGSVLSLFFLALSFIGFFIPVLPSTPFILLSSFFAIRSSTKLNNYVKKTRMYNEHVLLFVEQKQMTLKAKVIILTSATFMLCFPFFLVNSPYLRIFIIILLSVKYVYFIKIIKTKQVIFND